MALTIVHCSFSFFFFFFFFEEKIIIIFHVFFREDNVRFLFLFLFFYEGNKYHKQIER